MLAVRIRGHENLTGAIGPRPLDAGAQGRTLASVDGVGPNDGPIQVQLGKNWRIGATGSIVDNEDLCARVLRL